MDSKANETGGERAALRLALASVVAAHGLQALSAGAIADAAGLPVATFERNYATGEECLLELVDITVVDLTRAVDEAVEPCGEQRGPAAWRSQLDAGFSAVLRYLSASPSIASACLVHALGLGEAGLARRDAALDRFVAYGESLRQSEREPVPALAVEMLIRGAYELIYARVARGQAEELPELLHDLRGLWVGPFGPGED